VDESNNDINVLNKSDLFVNQLRGEAPEVEFFVNGRRYTQPYYLADGIYPDWAVFVKSIQKPQTGEHKLFAEHQDGARKDVECAFGILQSRFHILYRPAHLYEQGDLQNIMLACIILHNMIIEDERDIEDDLFYLNEEATTSSVQQPTIAHAHDPVMAEVVLRDAEIRDRAIHKQLQSDLIDHIWQKFGNPTR
jgi:predicted MPP superfamily phosphohydrolase